MKANITSDTTGSYTAGAAEELRQTLLPGEMQVVVASLLKGPIDPGQIPVVVAAVIKTNRAVQYVVLRTESDARVLCTKLGDLSLAALAEIERAVSVFREMNGDEMFGFDRLPSLASLRRLGLVRSSRHAAWGLAVVRLSDWRVCEVVLREDPSS